MKKQTCKVGGPGNFINQMMANNATLPEVGKGATIIYYSDRSVAEVIEVSADGKTVVLEDMVPTHRTHGGEYADQFELTGHRYTIVWRQGAWRTVGKEIRFTDSFSAEIQQKYNTGLVAASLRKHEPELFERIYKGGVWPQEVIEGVTKAHTVYSRIKVIFGVRDFRYDLSF